MRSPRLAIWCYRPPRLDEQLLLWVRQDDIHLFQQVLRELIESGEAHGGGTTKLSTTDPDPSELGSAPSEGKLEFHDLLILRWRRPPEGSRDGASLEIEDGVVEIAASTARWERWIEVFEALKTPSKEGPRGYCLVGDDESSGAALHIAETLTY